MKSVNYNFSSNYSTDALIDLKDDDEEEQIKKATEESLKDYQRQNNFEVLKYFLIACFFIL